MTFSSLQPYIQRFMSQIPHTPTYRYASIIMLRETKTYAIFTTESGEQQDTEQTQAGLNNKETISRLVMFKRKQVAPERRTGKALARQYEVFPFGILQLKGKEPTIVYGADAMAEAETKGKAKDNKFEPIKDCYLTSGLCSHCTDCLLYGYAAIEGTGARKSRVMTDSCFTVRPYEFIQKQVKFNVIDEKTQTSGTITEFDYTMPGVFLPAVETMIDVTMNEFVYMLSNVLRTTRYGKENTRQGYLRNHILGIAFSDVELFANLELTQAFYDAFQTNKVDLSHGLTLPDFQQQADSVIKQLTQQIVGRLELVTGDKLAAILQDVRALNQDEKQLATFLRELNTQAASFVV